MSRSEKNDKILPRSSKYADIVKVSVEFADGTEVYIDAEDAEEWAEAVDWGVRWHKAHQIEKYGMIRTDDFQWKIK